MKSYIGLYLLLVAHPHMFLPTVCADFVNDYWQRFCLLSDKIEQTLSIDTSTVEIEERGVKLRLTVVDTPGFGDSIKNTGWFVYVLFMICIMHVFCAGSDCVANKFPITFSIS